jgi:ribosome-associated protein
LAEPSSLDLVVTAARAADAKKGEDTLVLDVSEVLSITGWFVITSGTNSRQVKTLAEEIEEQVFQAGGVKPLRVEGADALRWVLLDYGDFVVHVFLDTERAYYELERLWSDVPKVDWQPAGPREAAAGE